MIFSAKNNQCIGRLKMSEREKVIRKLKSFSYMDFGDCVVEWEKIAELILSDRKRIVDSLAICDVCKGSRHTQQVGENSAGYYSYDTQCWKCKGIGATLKTQE